MINNFSVKHILCNVIIFVQLMCKEFLYCGVCNDKPFATVFVCAQVMKGRLLSVGDQSCVVSIMIHTHIYIYGHFCYLVHNVFFYQHY